MKNMKKYLFLLLALPLLFSCGDNGKSEIARIKDSLNSVNGGLKGEVGQKDSTIDSFIKGFNDIQDNLDQIKEKEKIVTKSSKDGDVKSREGQIVEDIQSIYNLLAQNKKRIAGLSANLKNSNVKNTELQKMIDHLTKSIEDKDIEIGDLKSQLEKLNVELSSVQTNLQETSQASDAKTEKLNTAYYAFGTAKELVKQNVLTKEGGFIGIGKTAKLKDGFNQSYFTKVDITTLKEVPLAAKKARLVTSHSSSSYKFEGTQGKKIEKLVITDSEVFWSESKYLVIVID